MVKDQYPDAVKEATGTVLPVWLEAFKTLLNVDPRSDIDSSPNWDGLSIRIQVFKVRCTLLTADRRMRETSRLHHSHHFP